MNTKLTFNALIAAATLAAAGVAMAQANPPTSTPGAGCTATANAMRGGNLGGSATNKDCVSPGASTAAAPAATTAAPATTASTTTSATESTAMGNTAAKPAKPMRVAKSDRN